MFNWMAFVDFDGTITAEDTLAGAMSVLNPQGLQEITCKMLAGEISLSQGLHLLFSRIPSNRYNEVDDYIRAIPLRKGFLEFLVFMKRINIPVVITSGGLAPMLDTKLEPFIPLIYNIHSVRLDLSGKTMRLSHEYDNGVEVMDKVKVMNLYDYRHSICIGDSFTDFHIAEKSNVVFARDYLAKYLDEGGLHYHSWKDFFDIIALLSENRHVECMKLTPKPYKNTLPYLRNTS